MTALGSAPHVQPWFAAGAALGRAPGAVFLDRDGVINENRPGHVLDWTHFRFLPGALDAFALLARHDMPAVVVTNQSAVGRGLTSVTAVDDIHRRLERAVLHAGGQVMGVSACMHAPEAGCGCRKPMPGLLHSAADRHRISLRQSVLIGDHLTDLQAASRAGVPSLLVMSGRTAEAPSQLPAGCIGVHRDLLAAVRWLIGTSAERDQMSRRREPPPAGIR